jgi:tetratricopeptide (TPR) repeat protein
MLSVAKEAGETCQTRAWNHEENAEFLVNQGRSIARQGDFSKAMKTFQQAQKLSPTIEVPAEDEVKRWAAGGSIEKGENLVKDGKVQEAVDAFLRAKQLDATWKIPPESWDTLCWYGALKGGAKTAISACDTAVALAPGNFRVRESRGVARALTGDRAGAIADFQAFIEGTDSADRKKQRQGWIDKLKKGENPFTKEEIAKLLG